MTAPLGRRLVWSLAAPVAALAVALLMSSLVLVVSGSDPLAAYGDMLAHARKLETAVDILNRATPLYIAGVAVALAFRMNLFNIGVEGQYVLAALVAAHLGSQVALPPVVHVAFVLLVAMTVGAGFAGLAGVLKVTRGVNEVISTIMLNAIAISGLVAWLVKRWQAGGSITSGNATRVGTTPLDGDAKLPTLNGVLELVTREIRQGKELTGMLLVAIAVGVVYYVLLNRTRFGYDLRATGINPFAARAGGVPPKRMVVIAMVLSGAIAGLIGLAEVFQVGYFPANPIRGLGFTGIAVALLGRNHPIGIAVGALIFAFLDVSSGVLQFTGAASREIVVIMQGVIILAAVIAYEIARRAQEREEARTASAVLASEAA